MTEQEVQTILSRLNGGLMDRSGINVEAHEWHAIAEFLATAPNALGELQSVVAHHYHRPDRKPKPPKATKHSIREWVRKHEPNNYDAFLALLRMKVLDVVMKCYKDDGNLEDILVQHLQDGCPAVNEYTENQCLEALMRDYDGNGLECSADDFLMLRW